MSQSLHIIFASGSGHTQYVIEQVAQFLTQEIADLNVEIQRVEQASAEDLTRGDILLLASGSWNTNGQEGQFHPWMYTFVHKTAKAVDLAQKPTLVVALGDERYTFTCGVAPKLEQFVDDHNGKRLQPTLRIINEPYGQEEKIEKWCKEIGEIIKMLNG